MKKLAETFNEILDAIEIGEGKVTKFQEQGQNHHVVSAYTLKQGHVKNNVNLINETMADLKNYEKEKPMAKSKQVFKVTISSDNESFTSAAFLKEHIQKGWRKDTIEVEKMNGEEGSDMTGIDPDKTTARAKTPQEISDADMEDWQMAGEEDAAKFSESRQVIAHEIEQVSSYMQDQNRLKKIAEVKASITDADLPIEVQFFSQKARDDYKENLAIQRVLESEVE